MYNLTTKDQSIKAKDKLYTSSIPLKIFVLLVLGLKDKVRTLRMQLSNCEISKKEGEEREEILTKELDQKKIENLRFALNPHSFKNTLNTIEHLAKSTFQSVNSLSGIFDYMLYDAKSQFVPLENEVNFAKQYLSLYKLRLSPIVDVKITIDPTIENDWVNRKLIAPLIFAHFIENAFKHGNLISDEAFIHIKIEPLNENELVYSVKNQISKKKSNSKGGIGNDAFLERLDLLYKNNYSLNYYENNGTFSANLKLNLYHE